LLWRHPAVISRRRTKVTKGHGSKAARLAMAFKLIESAQRRWRMVNAPHLVALRLLTVTPGDALFIDDTPGHITTAQSLGMTGHLHTSTAGTITRNC
jgi:hypothetical protein